MKNLGYLDGGRSRVVRKNLTPLADDVRERLGFDIVLILYQSPNSPVACGGAASAVTESGLPLPNEPLRIHGVLASRRPASRYDLVLDSAIRPYSLCLSTALV